MKKIFPFLFLLLLALLVWFPLYMLLTGALSDTGEIASRLGGVLGESDDLASWPLLNARPTLKNLVSLLLDTPEFFRVFFNSAIQAFPAVLLQVVVGAPAAWALAQFAFKGRGALTWLYVVLMILPFQVTMAPSYIVLDKLSLVDTHLSIILPAAFSTFPVFVMTNLFSKVPPSVLEAARMDGAGEWRTFLHVGLPMGAPGILSAALLGFMECWSAVEQPITFLKTATRFPLSIFLPHTTLANAGASFVCAIVTLLPALLLFLFGQKYLEQGIIASGIKE